MPVPSRREAIVELAELTVRLASNRTQLGDLEAQAHRLKLESWMGSDSEYIGARDRVADFNAVDLTCDILTLKGEIAADVDRRAFLELVITEFD
jgi:hypothetical protein